MMGRHYLSTQDGTNFCVADTITVVIKQTAASTDFRISNEKIENNDVIMSMEHKTNNKPTDER